MPFTRANLSTFIHRISCFLLLPVLSRVKVIKEIAPSAVRPTPVRNIIQPPPIPSQAAAATPAADPVVAAAASANTVENVTTATGVNCQPAAPPSPHGHTTMAAPQPMPSEELPALPSTEMRDALLAAAKWAEKAHAPPPATVLKEVREEAWSENEMFILVFMSMRWCVWCG